MNYSPLDIVLVMKVLGDFSSDGGHRTFAENTVSEITNQIKPMVLREFERE